MEQITHPAKQTGTSTNVHASSKRGDSQALNGSPRKKRALVSRLVIGLAILLLAGLGGYYALKQMNGSALIDKNAYQAVFLTNGQVYFGKLDHAQKDYLKMTDIYYLQVQDAQPAGEAVKDANTTPEQAADDTKLIKLGDELHAPQDRMVINKDQVLYWEDLKSDGKVAEAIRTYKEKK